MVVINRGWLRFMVALHPLHGCAIRCRELKSLSWAQICARARIFVSGSNLYRGFAS